MQLYFSAGLILAIVLWGIAAPNSLGGVFDMLLAVITRNFGWLYLWVVLGLVVLAMVLVLLFFVTSGDSATLVLGMMSTGGQANPSSFVKVIWGLLVSGIAISLLLAGGVKAVQTATIVFALPFTLVIVLMAVALWRGVREDWDVEQKRNKALRRRMREVLK